MKVKNVPDWVRIAGMKEIADWIGIPSDTVKKWRDRYDAFPEPKWTVGGDPAWDWAAVHNWLHDTGRWNKIAQGRLITAGIDPELITFPDPSRFVSQAHLGVNGWAVRLWDMGPDRWEIDTPSKAAHPRPGGHLGTAKTVEIIRKPVIYAAGTPLNDERVLTAEGDAVTAQEASERLRGKRYVTVAELTRRCGLPERREPEVQEWLDKLGETGPWSDRQATDLVRTWWDHRG